VAEDRGSNLAEVMRLALQLGATAFGGPAAHTALLRREAVARRGWVADARFLDLMGLTNLIPGPNSTELVMLIGRERAGWRGLWFGGLCFILPASLLTLGFAWLYERYGTTPAGGDLLRGIQPVILAVVAQAVWGLGRTAVRGAFGAILAVGVVALSLAGGNELVLLFGAGVVALGRTVASEGRIGALVLALPIPLWWPVPLVATAGGDPRDLSRLFGIFLKIGATLYGSGYVLVAFLRNDLVARTGWLTEAQLLDAVAVGQVTPGPVLTTATFVGYLVGGVPGAVLATVGIFLPAFLFVAVAAPLLPRLRRSRWLSAALDGINLAAIGLMGAVTWTLGREALDAAWTVVLAVAALVLLVRFRVNSVWIIAAGGAAGLLAGAAS